MYHEYYETEGINFFKQELLNAPIIATYEEINNIIQKSIIKGITKTLINELENNDSILKEFNKFAYNLDKKIQYKEFFNRLYEGSKAYNVISAIELNNIINKPLLTRTIPPYTDDFQCQIFGIILKLSRIIEIRKKYNLKEDNSSIPNIK